MARKSRRQDTIQNDGMQKHIEWRAAIYVRLSIEDSGIKDSDSIDTQISLVKHYIERRPYLSLIDTYVDNGSSGVNFQRPGFNHLISDIQQGVINCVVVKDLSRFGRNYIEASEYLDKIFPIMKVRFISVNDGYDSESKTSHMDGLIVSLKNLINDAYAKDISRKVKSARKTQRERGHYTGPFAPFGYKKLDSDRGKLIPDEETASVVWDIFQWRAEGMGEAAIAKRLDEMGIPCPSMRLRNKGIVKGEGYYKATVWQQRAIKRIICSKVYMGHMVQGKTSQAIYEYKHWEALPESEWCIVENTHEPLVSVGLWVAANQIQTERGKKGDV